MSKLQKQEHITSELLTKCEVSIGHSFANRSLLKQALIHASLRDMSGICNERLEFLGDAVLGLIISEFLYITFPDFSEGDLSLVKSEVVSRNTLARIAQNLQLHHTFAYSKGMQKNKMPHSMLANVMEAVIGAMYLDSGIETVRQFILNNFRQEIEQVIRNPYQQNYKSLLQCIAQKYFSKTPYYQVLRIEGPNHTRTFTACAVIAGRNFVAGQGKSKKAAEQAAAYAALQLLALEDPAISEMLQTLIPNKKKKMICR